MSDASARLQGKREAAGAAAARRAADGAHKHRSPAQALLTSVPRDPCDLFRAACVVQMRSSPQLCSRLCPSALCFPRLLPAAALPVGKTGGCAAASRKTTASRAATVPFAQKTVTATPERFRMIA